MAAVVERRFARGPGRDGSLATAVREAALLLGAALVLTILTWALRPDRLPLRADPAVYELDLAAPLVTPAAARALYDAGDHLFVDVRPGTPAATVPGAFLVREDSFDDDLLRSFDFLTPADPLVVFGAGELAAASNVAGRLLDRGWQDVVIMSGGLAAWEAAGGPVVPLEDAP
ncbi:MAG: rhodanese-like domain-containing protein [Candidatus Krumholzibacteriia bacterium]